VRFYLTREEPVQEIAAHPDTLAQLIAAFPKATPNPTPWRDGSGFSSLIGLPLVPDPEMRPGRIHLRPFPRPTQP
jgi:hypothetical protein